MRIPDGVMVAVGGGLGAWLRFLVTGWVQVLADRLGGWARRPGWAALPLGTMVVNLGGAFLLGALLRWSLGRGEWGASTARLFLGIGVLGGFTTFSTLCYEGITLLQRQQWRAAFFYLAGQWFLGLLGCYGGWTLGRML